MKATISRRAAIRAGAGLGALVLVLGGLAWQGHAESRRYQRELEAVYLRSLQELSSYVGGISTTLGKTVCAGTPEQLDRLSSMLWRESGSAKAALSGLPVTAFDLTNTYKFLSQVGSYAVSLAEKNASGEPLTPEEQHNLEELLRISRGLQEHIEGVERRVSRGELSMGTIAAAGRSWQDGAAQESPAPGRDGAENSDLLGIKELEESFEGAPRLIYDGPFSDHLMERTPAMTRDRETVTWEKAREKAAKAGSYDPRMLQNDGEEQSRLEAWRFSADGFEAAVTKKGGYLVYLQNGRAIGERTVDNAEAVQLGRKWMHSTMGLTDLKETYYETANGVCTINFAYEKNGVLCYTDLIKVGVAVDNGQVVFADTRGYLMNHRDRALPEPALTEEEARRSVNPRLDPEPRGLALIPTEGMKEVLTYEYRCKSPATGQNVLVYINAETGAEEQILLLIETPEGVLTL